VGGIEVTGTAQRRSWESVGLPDTERVRPGLWSIPVPLPNNPLRYVLVYLLELDNGVAVIDTGWSTEEAWAALVAGMAVAGFAPSDVRAILITHIHPDHYGLAGRLREASGAWVALHPADAALLPARYGRGLERLLASMDALLIDAGVPDETRAELTGASMGIREFVAAAEPDVLLEDRVPVPLPGWDLVPLHTPGHSPGHVAFRDTRDGTVIAGDVFTSIGGLATTRIARSRLRTAACMNVLNFSGVKVVGFIRTPIVAASGRSSRRISSRLPIKSNASVTIPVALPSGRLRFATSPSSTGLRPFLKTIGMVAVTALAACATPVPLSAAITPT